ncbi:MAG: 4-(cytidine 5'-diphospho)-2-C-methyl-D-erythritol kinase [bacterium]|nr:4-(cytidine 5'-diphospho)-2-C-methyl-D-erythritol kinase [bacterium]
MDTIHIRALAKINLGLDVTGVREDGYHLVKMIMQTIDLYDWVTITKTDDDDIHLTTNLNYLPTDEHNIAYQAAALLKRDFPRIGGLMIDIYKCIPVAAGMAGGSTNAAAVLFGLNKLYSLGLSKGRLMEYGLMLGADVPYCLLRGTALAEGIGEKLTRLEPMPDCFILIAKPPMSVSTKMVYEALDANKELIHPPIDVQLEALKEGNLGKLVSNMGNVLETVTIPLYPQIQTLKDRMYAGGAIASMMSGSGPTVFGIFDDEAKAYAMKEQIRSSGLARQVYVTKPFNVSRGQMSEQQQEERS